MITNIVIAYRAVLIRSAAKLLPERNSPEKGIFNSLFITKKIRNAQITRRTFAKTLLVH
ncbi:MAG: hypothetical protein J6I76_02990 [Oribacterium sp.]|nr:hypothetical protein [Oribacterium sp.]